MDVVSPRAVTRALARVVALDGALLWRKLRKLAALAEELRPALRLFASALFARRRDPERRAAAIAAEGAGEGAAAVAAAWRGRKDHADLRGFLGLSAHDAPALQWAVRLKHGALADYALEWRARRKVPSCAAAEMPAPLAALLDAYAAALLVPEWPELYSPELAALADGLAAATAATLAGTPLRPLRAPPAGSVRALVAELQKSEAETLAHLGAETEINESCGVNMAALSCEIMEAVLDAKDTLLATEGARLQLTTEISILSALISRVMDEAESAPAPAAGEAGVVAALRACAEKDGLEWRLLKTLTRALSQATLMLQKNTATRCYHITA